MTVSISVPIADAQDAVQVQLQHLGDELVSVDGVINSTGFAISEFNDTDLHIIRNPWPRNSLLFLLFNSLDFRWDDFLQIAFHTA